MIKKLRRKIVLMNMILICTVLLISLITFSYSSVKATAQELYRSLQYQATLTMSDASPSDVSYSMLPAKVPHVIATSSRDKVWNILHDDITLDSDALLHALVHCQQANKSQDVLLDLRLAYVRHETAQGTLIVLGDAAMVLASLRNSLIVGSLVMLLTVLLVFAVVLYMSKDALKPTVEAMKQQRQFIADASHELKTPLTVIAANNNIILSHENQTVAEQRKWLTSTLEEVNQMRSLIDEMLTLARADSKQTEVSMKMTSASDLIEEEVLFLEPVAYEKDILVVSRIEKNIFLNTDPTFLKKLAVILLDNAIKHGRPGAPVTVSLVSSKSVILSVHNCGTPIPKEDLPYLFDRFYRSDKSRSTSGHGLGLAIAHAIAQRLDAKLSVESTEEAGTTFSVEFKK